MSTWIHLLKKENTQTRNIHSPAAHCYSRTTHVWNKLLLNQYRGRNQIRNQSDETKQAVYWTITACIRTLCLISSSSAEPSWVQVCLFTADWGSGHTQTTAERSWGQRRRDISQKPRERLKVRFHIITSQLAASKSEHRPYYTANEHLNTINKYRYVYSLYILLLHKTKFYNSSWLEINYC